MPTMSSTRYVALWTALFALVGAVAAQTVAGAHFHHLHLNVDGSQGKHRVLYNEVRR
jgi:hypothetical protein